MKVSAVEQLLRSLLLGRGTMNSREGKSHLLKSTFAHVQFRISTGNRVRQLVSRFGPTSVEEGAIKAILATKAHHGFHGCARVSLTGRTTF